MHTHESLHSQVAAERSPAPKHRGAPKQFPKSLHRELSSYIPPSRFGKTLVRFWVSKASFSLFVYSPLPYYKRDFGWNAHARKRGDDARGEVVGRPRGR